MRIGVDATSWFNARGYGRFTRELLAAMVEGAPQHEFTCFVDARDTERLELAAGNARIRGVELAARPVEAAAARGSRSLADMLRMTRAVRAERPEVMFYPTVYSYFPAPARIRTVVGVHDAIAERFPLLTLPSLRARLFWRAKVRLALWQARLVLTVSEFAAREIESVLGVPRQRIRVTHEAPAAVYRLESSAAQVRDAQRRVGLPAGARYFVYVGGFNPHKNVETLVRAHRRLDDSTYLLLVGALHGDVFHTGIDSIRAVVRDAGTAERVIWTDFVDDDELRHLHHGALAVVLPSRCEGFGLPAVEAAACGTPIVATVRSPLPELFADAGLFFDPGDEAALSDALRTLTTDEERRRAMGARARACADRLTWRAAADTALEALVEAAR